jgi:hypothetical protein
MKHKKYIKGSHTYTRWGNVTEVKSDAPGRLEAEFGDGTKEVYANSFQVAGRPEALHVRFTKIIPPVEKIYDSVTAVLSYDAARRLMKDLERMLKNDG